MAPSSRASETENKLQAVVVADSFYSKFEPLSKDVPRCLLPLANVPIIEYTLHFLASGGVDEVIIVCCSRTEEVFSYVKGSKWCKSYAPFSIKLISSPDSRSISDMLRDLDAKQIIVSDFVLTRGDVVSNLPLHEIVDKHNNRKQIDRNTLMTITVREASQFHKSRSAADAAVYAIDEKSSRCLFYQPIVVENTPIKAFSLDMEIFENNAEVTIRNDLIDCGVDICSPEVLALLTENFDYQDLRRDFVFGIITSDILNKSIYCNVAKTGYAAQLGDLQTYMSVSNDIITRWAFSMVPETRLISEEFKYFRNNVYKGRAVFEAPSMWYQKNLLIGTNTKIEADSRLSDSIIGSNCMIGSSTRISHSIIWNEVTVGSNCELMECIVGWNVKIGDNCKLEQGCVIGSGVVLDHNSTIPASARISRTKDYKSDSGDETSSSIRSDISYDTNIVGINGLGYLMRKLDFIDGDYSDLSEDENLLQEVEDIHDFNITSRCEELVLSDEVISDEELDYFLGSDVSSENLLNSVNEKPQCKRGRSDSILSNGSEEGRNSNMLIQEAIQSLKRAYEENHKIENALLELNTLRMAENLSYSHIRAAIMKFLLQTMNEVVLLQPENILSAASRILDRWGPVLARAVFSVNDQAECIMLLQRICSRSGELPKYFLLFLQWLYNHDVIDDKAVIMWFSSPDAKTGSEEHVKLRNEKGLQFIKWLQESDEEDEDDNNDDEDEST